MRRVSRNEKTKPMLKWAKQLTGDQKWNIATPKSPFTFLHPLLTFLHMRSTFRQTRTTFLYFFLLFFTFSHFSPSTAQPFAWPEQRKNEKRSQC